MELLIEIFTQRGMLDMVERLRRHLAAAKADGQ
jgi:hypothetical protein